MKSAKLLLDTHALLWYATGDSKVSARALSAIGDLGSRCYLSVATVWEIVLKYRTRKLSLPYPPAKFLESATREMRLIVLPVELGHALRTLELPPIHRDPFDRLLVAQALVEGMQLVTADEELSKYPIKVLW